ncbi:MAG: membrane protein insertase YidC, partial [Candidatus Rokubacteria bacterium]|nr:membrane protein insertase YidC [Candidatus Rokubacteria bacterium]
MEKRAILAAVLIAGLLIFYQALFPPSPPPPPQAEKPKEQEPTRAPEAPALPPPIRAPSPPAQPARAVTVETPLYRAQVASEAGRLMEWAIHYRGEKPMIVTDLLGSKGVSIHRGTGGSQPLSFDVGPERLVVGPDRARGELSLRGTDPYGLAVIQSLSFNPHDFRLEVQVKLENKHSVPQAVEVWLPWFTHAKWPEGRAEQFQGQRPTRVVKLSANGVQREELDKVGEATADGEWIGLESEWYIAALIPRTPGFKLVTKKGPDSQVEIAIKAVPPTLAPGQSWEGRALVYLGPKEYDRLRALGVGLEEAIYWGGFPWSESWFPPPLPMAWIAVPILWLMNFVYRFVPNYGVAIIALTVVTKIIFYPLTLKSMASMKAMQALQPQINALRGKYQKDPQRLQRETMELYINHKVNPMCGCLPMVIQIPIFYSLYLVFSLSVELQNAAFLCFGTVFGTALWICDLAQQDPTYILPILMGASMFVQQK